MSVVKTLDQMTDAEVLALALGTKACDRAAADLLATSGLPGLGRASSREMSRVKGIGPKGARRLEAAFELGRRALRSDTDRAPVRSAEDAFRLLRPRFAGLEYECFVAIALDARGCALGVIEIARGQLSGVEVHPRELFRPLIRMAAASVVVAHNHPSGDPTPSQEDLALTRRLKSVAELVGIPLLDHVVVAGNKYRSIAELEGS